MVHWGVGIVVRTEQLAGYFVPLRGLGMELHARLVLSPQVAGRSGLVFLLPVFGVTS